MSSSRESIFGKDFDKLVWEMKRLKSIQKMEACYFNLDQLSNPCPECGHIASLKVGELSTCKHRLNSIRTEPPRNSFAKFGESYRVLARHPFTIPFQG